MLHVHHFGDEGFYILEGEMTFHPSGREDEQQPRRPRLNTEGVGDVLGAEEKRAGLRLYRLITYVEGLIREMGEPARTLTIPPQPEEPPDEAEMGRLTGISAPYRAEMLGPPSSQ